MDLDSPWGIIQSLRWVILRERKRSDAMGEMVVVVVVVVAAVVVVVVLVLVLVLLDCCFGSSPISGAGLCFLIVIVFLCLRLGKPATF